MSDAPATILDGAKFTRSAPAFDPSRYVNLTEITKAVHDLTHNSDDAHASLAHSSAAERFYAMETAMNNVVQRIGEVNEAVAAELKALRDSLVGEAGDALQSYGTAILKQSEDLYSTLSGGQYGTAVGNIGHAIQAFAAGWWQIHAQMDDDQAAAKKILENEASRYIQESTTQQQVDSVAPWLKKELDSMYDQAATERLKRLREALGALVNQYQNRGNDLAPIQIISGFADPAAASDVARTPQEPVDQAHGLDSLPADGELDRLQDPLSEQKDSALGEEATEADLQQQEAATEGGAGTGAAGSATDPALEQAKQQAADAAGALTDAGAQAGTDTPAEDTATPAEGTATPAEGTATPAEGSGSAGTPATAPATDPAAEQALQDAKQAANDAINGLTSPASTGTEGSAGTGGGAAPGSEGSGAVPAGGVGGGVPSAQQSAADAKRKQALDDAKKAANDAIDSLTGQPATESSGPAGGGAGSSGDPAGAAKDAAGQAIDDLASSSPEQQQALDQAKQAAQQAIDDLTAGGVTDPAQLAEGASEAIDKLGAQTEDPATQEALANAKQAALDAINGDPAADTPRQAALDDAKSAVHEAIDSLDQPDSTPEEKQAYADAKAAVDKAIDGLADSDPLADFLGGDQTAQAATSPAPLGSGVGAGSLDLGGSGGGVGGSGGGAGGSVALPAAAGSAALGQFDTQPAQAAVLPAAAVPAGTAMPAIDPNLAAQGGMPMGGMPMGGAPMGAGGMGGGANGEQREREPQIWLQAEEGSWGDQDGPQHRPVLGRD
ncbi:hypothetical protein DMC64_37040 [Amycolatopsis sp. WAC 04197]|uniref:hypothetical protein n=1 Tax=Amycolatopsis sp. WAC 04197 TaxID=2203199 RepID=UPI000F7AF292|nr:hypothetical protein [Amycolatopsis sp. WAC 04197]RSN39927.1 hypothetical protein DMC64_37040 [Amycolatopsis sp. WAC 04197]